MPIKSGFTAKLMHWNRHSNNRVMPWKGEKEPYRIWLSEIILQQTRVEQGMAYYEKFIRAFPTIHHLAKAPPRRVFKLWEGLGYYTRCKNLIDTAVYISKERKGVFPQDYDGILSLKGIGPYTAAAIASFAFQLPYAVLDGNVLRVLSRYFGINTPIDSAAGKKLYALLAQELLYRQDPGRYNQAIMDFGALICTPRQPLCTACPQKADCQAFRQGIVKDLPVKEKQLQKKHRWLYYFMVQAGTHVLVRKRTGRDIWQNLYEFVLYESREAIDPASAAFAPVMETLFGRQPLSIRAISPAFRQQLTHQTITGQFITIEARTMPQVEGNYEPVKKTTLPDYPFPKLVHAWWKQEAALQLL